MSRTRERKRIAKDPFHQQILEALGRHLDHQVFEACMADLLRDVFPGLVPVPGGNDAGMDAAVADGKGEPYPLVCTIGEDVARNLQDNLDAFRARGLAARKVALATSRALTPPETRELFRLAREKGFALLQVFERSALAFLLYRDSGWCKRLLGLTGVPSALSVVPLSRRPQVTIELRGRDEDAKWLQSTPRDRVVLGLPGSGKTYLFSSLIRSGWPALFLGSDNDTAIANAVRDQNPGVVIVDDAHVAPDRLVRLRRLRTEIQGEFEIVASAWPGARTEVSEAVGGLPESRIHDLGLLPRAQIMEIFHDLDVRPRDEILRDLVSQAGNKPGLAVTIALLWRQGEWQKILDGTVLSRTLLSLFKGLTGAEVADVLAAFSLGGRRGMSLEAVAGFLEIPSRDVWRIAADLATGGVLSAVDTERLAVNPQVLRSALLRQIFFPGSPIRLNYRKLLPLVPSFTESVGEIMAAGAYGAVIPTADLHDLVLQSNSRQAWSTLGVVSEEEARWVLENYPGDLLDVASGLLNLIPQVVIPRILERASEPMKKTGGWSLPEQPMRILSSWVEDIEADPEEWLQRRQMVAWAAKKFILGGGEKGTGVHAICIALSPNLLGDSLDPGRGNILTHSRGLLPPEALRQVGLIWDEVKEVIQVVDVDYCHYLSGILRDWYHPHSWAGSVEEAADKREIMREFARRVLVYLVARSQGSPGWQTHLGELAEEFGISVELEQDPIFLLLYDHDLGSRSRREGESARGAQIKALATEWARDEPKVVIQKIAFYEAEAKKSSGHMPNMEDFCRELAALIQEPESWLDECLSQGLRGDLTGSFLERIVRDRREGWESLLTRSLEIESLKRRAATLVLTCPDPPLPLLEKVLDEFSDLATLVKERCLNRTVPLPTLSRLLHHSRWEVALAAAVGEWWAEPQGGVREEVLPKWRSAILRSRTDEYRDTDHNMGLQYSLGCILSGDPGLALEWLRNRLCDPDFPHYFMDDSPFAHALRALGKEQRLALLQELEPAPIVNDMLLLLIREDVEVYGQLLSLKRLSDYHFAPLAGLPQKAWSNLALIALQFGYEPAQVAEAAFKTHHTERGSGIEYWEKWDLAFAEIGREENPELQEVARYGRERAQEELQRARKLDKQIDIHGLVGGLIPHRNGR